MDSMVSNDLLNGPVIFEEASAGDCIGNYTVGGWIKSVVFKITFCISFMASLLGTRKLVSSTHNLCCRTVFYFRHTFCRILFILIFLKFKNLFRSEWIFSSPSVGCWLTFCLMITFLSFVDLCINHLRKYCSISDI
uniref:Transmembrane protein n=1 Tax=Heterorhabditis bacteriophora TaxID=37862 RepID=A0A1I7WP99_HETBA